MAKKKKTQELEMDDQTVSFIEFETELSPTIVTRKDNLELTRQYREVIRNWMVNEKNMNYRQVNKVLAIFDLKIDHSNIRYYYSRHADLFLKALVMDKLDSIKNYNPRGYYESKPVQG